MIELFSGEAVDVARNTAEVVNNNPEEKSKYLQALLAGVALGILWPITKALTTHQLRRWLKMDEE